jgi:NADH:ubiquinone oxidoreductase subunit 3 (subunit A)
MSEVGTCFSLNLEVKKKITYLILKILFNGVHILLKVIEIYVIWLMLCSITVKSSKWIELVNMFMLITGPVDLGAKVSEKEENGKSG